MNPPRPQVLTIGHSTHSSDAFEALLKLHRVTALADVRSAPYSRFNPHFNREALEQRLKVAGIRYVFLGRELGARSEDPSCYENGRVKYARIARTDLFGSGLERVVHGAMDHRIALMCAEKEPLECHRTVLVAQCLVERGVDVRHILATGVVETHDETMDRLCDLVGVPRADLFRPRCELVAEALVRQEERIAYVDDRLAAESKGEAL